MTYHTKLYHYNTVQYNAPPHHYNTHLTVLYDTWPYFTYTILYLCNTIKHNKALYFTLPIPNCLYITERYPTLLYQDYKILYHTMPSLYFTTQYHYYTQPHYAFTLHWPTLPCSPWLYHYCIFHTFTPLNATTLCQCFTNTVQSIIAQLCSLTTLHSTLPLLCNSLLYHYFTVHSYTLPSHYFTRLDCTFRDVTLLDLTLP